jgi:hypothetical protein
MSAVQIRALLASDGAEWRRLWTLYLEFYQTSVPEEVYATTFDRLLSAQDNEFACLVALQEFNEAGRRLYDRVGKLTPFIRYSR